MISNFDEITNTLLSRDFDGECIQGDKIYVQPGVYALSSKKLKMLLRIAELQKYYQCNPVRFIDDFFNIELLDAQAWIVQRAWTCPNVLLVCTRGFGKALSLDTKIPTPYGIKYLCDIKVGDYVFGDDGVPTKVTALSPIWNNDCYKIRFSDGEEIIANEDHLWSLYLRNTRHKGELEIRDTKWVYEHYKPKTPRTPKDGTKFDKQYRECNLSVPISKPLKYSKKKLDIDPYILGIWLGDGCSEAGYITSSINDYKNMIENIESRGYYIQSIRNDSYDNKRITIKRNDGIPLTTLLRNNNLINNKHIPNVYLLSDIDDRLLLLQGLMDTDGSISQSTKWCEFTQSDKKHKKICDGFSQLLISLGIVFSSSICDRRYEHNGVIKKTTAMRFSFCASKEMPVFMMNRKYNLLRDKLPLPCKKKYITDVEKVKSVETRCIQVDNESHLFLCGEKNTVTHNSTVIDLYTMAKDMLFNNYWTFIASGSGSQAEQTFTTLERLANDNIDTMVGSTGYIFKAEIEIKNAAGDGFSHSSNGFTYSLYNGAMTQTLNSNIDKKRGMRGNVIFDECGFLDAEMLNVYGAFAIVNKSFKSGKDRDGNRLDTNRVRSIPEEIPNQKFYISSASSTDMEFYTLYRDFSKRMLMGDPNYFVAQIDCEVAFKPTVHGELMPPLLTQDTVDAAMRANPEKARREYYCIFTTDAGANAIIRRGTIARNEEVRKPILYNDTGKRKIVIAYDPARSRDNSVILVAEIYDFENNDGSIEKKMRLLNCINLIDIEKKKKKPMRTPEQVEILKQVILDYNQGGDENYSNILGVYIDAGSGGAGVNIADYLMPDWTDKAGVTHRGLIDKEYSEEYVKNFPKAVDKIRLMSPSKYKSEMYEAMIELMDQDKISFTASYDNKGYLTIVEVDEEKTKKEESKIREKLKKKKMSEEDLQKAVEKEMESIQNVNTRIERLNWQEEVALVSIDALKEELVNMVRIKRKGDKDSFELSPEKQTILHDDRAYTASMCSYALMKERRKNITNRPKKNNSNIANLLASQTKRSTRKISMFDN